jgi:hypothetical protein
MDLSGRNTELKFKGKFPARVTKTSDKDSKSGKKMWMTEFTVVGNDFKGYRVSEYYLHENDRSMNKLAKLASVLELDLTNVEVEDFANHVVEIEVTTDKEGNSKVLDFAPVVNDEEV